MKIILTATSPDINSPIDARFGLGAYFIVVDPDTMEWEAHQNPGASAPGGAGTLAAHFAVNQRVSAIISGDYGPNAFYALQGAGIDMYLFGSCATVVEAIEHFKEWKLENVSAPTGWGRHWQTNVTGE